MRTALPIACLLFVPVVLAAEPAVYRNGWNDLNKNGKKDVYEDPSRPVSRRVADLLERMTLDEKVGQLVQGLRETTAEKDYGERLRLGRISSFLGGSEIIETPALRNRLQRIAVEQSRLGIPLMFGHDSIHGFRTIFPIPLAQACAWEPDLFERTQTISARETAAVGIDWTFAPMVDLARDPALGSHCGRIWRRSVAGRGVCRCVRARISRDQSRRSPDRVVSCLKHYVGYGAAEGGRDYNTTEISEYTLRNFYLPQFKAGVGRRRLDRDERVQLSVRRSRQRQSPHADRHPARRMEIPRLRRQRLGVGRGTDAARRGGRPRRSGAAGAHRRRGHGNGLDQLQPHTEGTGEAAPGARNRGGRSRAPGAHGQIRQGPVRTPLCGRKLPISRLS